MDTAKNESHFAERCQLESDSEDLCTLDSVHFFKEKQSWEGGGDVLGDKKKIEYMYEFVFKCTEEKNSIQRHTGLLLQKIEEKESAEKQYTIPRSRLKKCVQTTFMVTTGQWSL